MIHRRCELTWKYCSFIFALATESTEWEQHEYREEYENRNENIHFRAAFVLIILFVEI